MEFNQQKLSSKSRRIIEHYVMTNVSRIEDADLKRIYDKLQRK